jgi:hypothetical protein
MGVPISDVGYTSATTGRGNHEVRRGHVLALEIKRSLKEGSYVKKNEFPVGYTITTGMLKLFREINDMCSKSYANPHKQCVTKGRVRNDT